MMKINLEQIDRSSFYVNERYLASGERVWLVIPQHVGCKWNKHNLIFRSSVWNDEGEPVSLSFKKFFNWDEQPDLDFKPFSLTANGGCEVLEKLDGSTLIVSKYKGELIVRTRGTIDASTLENGFEIAKLKFHYPKAFNHPLLEQGHTLLFEWTSPFNQIVIDYGNEPEIFLIGAINHEDYKLLPQSELDRLANEMGINRPQRFNFNDIPEMLEAIEKLEGQEGVCVYGNKGQSIRKVKGAWYLSLHRFKNQATLENVVDLFCEYGYPTYNEFKEKLSTQFDHECWNMVQGYASQVCDAYKEAKKIIVGMNEFVENLFGLPRKEQAAQIFSAYGVTNRTSFVFMLLDGYELDKKQVKKLIHQCCNHVNSYPPVT